MRLLLRAALIAAALMPFPTVATAQTPPLDQSLLEAHIGQAWFIDDSALRHDVLGIGVSRPISSRFRLKATLTHMRGPGEDRDWLLVGHTSFDIVKDLPARPVVPFIALGIGAMRHTNTDYGRDIGGIGPTVLLTAGLRVRVGDRWFIAPEAGLGLEAHTRAGITIGVRR